MARIAAVTDSPNGSGLGRQFVLPLVAATVGVIALSVGMLWIFPGPEPVASSGGVPIVATTPQRARPTNQLYKELCSLCHGATGAGDGPTVLERPARSFVAGGYGYGNTLATVMRTLEFGIPGTAMPAFGETLSLQERTALASYVLGLGPKPRSVSPGDGEIAASSRPTAVQGAMQDPSAGALEPRSLLIGFPDGTAVQYRAPDVDIIAFLETHLVDDEQRTIRYQILQGLTQNAGIVVLDDDDQRLAGCQNGCREIRQPPG